MSTDPRNPQGDKDMHRQQGGQSADKNRQHEQQAGKSAQQGGHAAGSDKQKQAGQHEQKGQGAPQRR